MLLTDGRIAAIRPLVATDRAGLMALLDAVGDESLWHTGVRTSTMEHIDSATTREGA